MKAGQGREIVVEYERVQRIKKRSSTQLFHCDGCDAVSDFLSLKEASSLFEIEPERLTGFIAANRCHIINSSRKTYVCLVSLLSRMKVNADITDGRTALQLEE